MQYLSILIAILAAVHAYSFAQWLKDNDNKVGAYGVYVMIILGLALPIYRLFQNA
ncbi:hypothetical protein SDC9_04068 [bioreactor metagenome]|uniref:Uncharacterized protein n=1 Tax=bioreactor metagenome TaxID=1076179 RepID=A0A644SV91_9ZZZZ|nr:hypothetical protein [Negativicutes bacterium]